VKIGTLLYHDVLELDAVGPHTVFRAAARVMNPDAPNTEGANAEGGELEVFTLGRTRASIKCAGGLVMTPLYPITGSAPDMDVLIVPGGPGAEKAGRDAAISTFLRERVPHLRFVGSVSTGAIVLGEAGLIEGLSVTTWPPLLENLWAFKPAEVLDRRVVRNPNGRFFASTSAAGMSLALEIVQHAFGANVAQKTADNLGLEWNPTN
jgi:transcriptional regulator GlxA family with amidase domain